LKTLEIVQKNSYFYRNYETTWLNSKWNGAGWLDVPYGKFLVGMYFGGSAFD